MPPFTGHRLCKIANTRQVHRSARGPTDGPSGNRRKMLLVSLLSATLIPRQARASEFASAGALGILNRQGDIRLSEEEWRTKLSAEEYAILRKASTERPFSSPLNSEKRAGTFTCAGCGTELFASETKYNSGTGWPSFYQALPGAVDEVPDFSIFFLPRTEVRCKACQGHLGHVFNDGPQPTGQRYCMNGAAMKFVPAESEA